MQRVTPVAAACTIMGKTPLTGFNPPLIARRIPTILPPLTREESLEVSSLYSISGKLPKENVLMRERPFLSPHHSISPQALYLIRRTPAFIPVRVVPAGARVHGPHHHHIRRIVKKSAASCNLDLFIF